MKFGSVFLLFFCFTSLLGFQECNFPFVPMPNDCIITQTQQLLYIKPCQIAYALHFDTNEQEQYRQIITHYQQKSFGCSAANILFKPQNQLKYYSYILNISIEDPQIKNVYSTVEQSYKLDISIKGGVLTSSTYVGFLRGLETFTQAFSCSQSKQNNPNQCFLSKLPISILDEPRYQIRGLLLDASRRFIPMDMLYKMMDALMYNKMNVFHWHLADDDTFPLILNKHPEFSQYHSFSQEERYTIKETKDFIRYAATRGIRVIAELDGPAHLNGVVGVPQNQDIRCVKNPLQSSIDQTSNKSYQIIKDILQEFLQIFPDPIIQLGGDEREIRCSKNSSYDNQSNDDLYIYFRNRVREIVKQINSSKTIMYWERSTEIMDKVFKEDEILQWWGYDLKSLPTDTKQKVVLSLYSTYYMSKGYGLINGDMWNSVTGWKDTYKALNHAQNPQVKELKVIGGVLCLWTGLLGLNQIFPYTWPRGIAMAQTAWNPNIVNFGSTLVKRLISQNKRMLKRGIPSQFITRAKCMNNYDDCQQD